MFCDTSRAAGAMPSARSQVPRVPVSPTTDPDTWVPCEDSSGGFGPAAPMSKNATTLRWFVWLALMFRRLASPVPGPALTCS